MNKFLKHTWLLGAVNGLILGIMMEMLYVRVYYDWEIRRAVEYETRIGSSYAVDMGPVWLHNPYAIPILSILTFALISWLLGRARLQNQIKSLVFWPLIGLLGTTVVVALYFSPKLYRLASYLNSGFTHHELLNLLWVWLFCLVVVSVINIFYGVALRAMLSKRR